MPDSPRAPEPRSAAAAAESAPKPIGQLGGFALLKKLGEGPISEVYLARDTELGREVALKVLTRATEQDLDRFFREAELVKRLEHSNIVEIYDIGVIDNRHCISMAYLEGGSLATATLSGLQEALAIIRDICGAIDYAHSKGIIHRDIKPSNILLDGRRAPYLADFGLAKENTGPISERTLSITGMVVGTPGFLSPEQAKGNVHKLSGATDIYALGATLYYLVTGRCPIQASSTLEAITRAAEGDFPDPTIINPAVPREVESIIIKAMSLDPRRRYGSGAEMADEITRYLRGDTVRATFEVTADRVDQQQETGWRVRRKVVVLAATSKLSDDLQMERVGVYETLHESTLVSAIKALKENAVDVVAACDDVSIGEARRFLIRARQEQPDAVRVLFVHPDIPADALMDFINQARVDVVARFDEGEDPLGTVLDQVLRSPDRQKSARSLHEQLRDTRRQLRAVQDSLFMKNRDLEEKNKYLEKQNDELEKIRSTLVEFAAELQDKNAALTGAYKRIEELSTTDTLTKVPNRRGFCNAAEHELEVAARYEHPVCVLMIDIDHFKKINDTWGHPVGDAVLEASADAIRGSIRQTDRMGRFGGEEFVVFSPRATAETGGEIAERIRAALESKVIRLPDGHDVRITVSIGVACAAKVHGKSALDTLIRKADEAMYRAKAAGRNQVIVGEKTL